MNKRIKTQFSTKLPLLLLVALGALMVIWVFWQAGNYGQTMDEPLRDAYGQSILGWYKSLGKDMSFIVSYPAFEYEPEHGAIFDLIAVICERIFKHLWYTHAIVIGLSGVAGVVAIALCGYEVAGLWGALLAAVGLWLYPRYLGAIFNNPKDIPFAAAMTWVLWSVFLLVKRWDSKKYFWYAMLVGFLIGLAASIRVTAIIWYAMLALMLVGWWIMYGLRIWHQGLVVLMLRKQIPACVGIGLVSLLTMMALWPYIALSPIAHLWESIQVLSHYPWNGTVLFGGTTYPAAHIPRWYAPVWLIIGSPPALVLGVALGIAVVSVHLLKKRIVDPVMVVVLLAFFVPLVSIVVLHSVLYGALRQILFLVPPMILIGVYGVVELWLFLAKYQKNIAIMVLTAGLLINYFFVAREIAMLYPYEYAYFSPIIGGLAGADHNYETDYWGSCQKASLEWLAANYHRYTKKQHPSVQGIVNFESLVTMHLPSNFRVDEKSPDFFIDVIGVNANKLYRSYHTIYEEKRESVIFCAVKTKQ